MRVAFMGSPDFSVPALKALYHAGHTITAVYCQPPRPAGRGHQPRRCPVHVAADSLGLPVHTPNRLRTNADAISSFAALKLDVAVVAAYGLILPQSMLDSPSRGCLNIHASLLPRWRGAGPIQAAILAGDHETGITIMQMDAGLDTGPMLLSQTVPITQRTTSAMLHDTLATLGAKLIVDTLTLFPSPVPQPPDGATYAPKLTREDGRIDWNRPAQEIDRRIRAFDPWPGTFTSLNGKPLKILAAEVVTATGTPGTVLDSALTVGCGSQAIRLTTVQLSGRSSMTADAFFRGNPVKPGTRLGL